MGKRGPKLKGEYTDKSAVLSTRISAELRNMLEDAVRETGLTISREVEHRLRQSFYYDRLRDPKWDKAIKLAAELLEVAKAST